MSLCNISYKTWQFIHLSLIVIFFIPTAQPSKLPVKPMCFSLAVVRPKAHRHMCEHLLQISDWVRLWHLQLTTPEHARHPLHPHHQAQASFS